MLIEQIFIGNSLRNFNYVIGCPESREALVIDPLNADLCIEAAKKHHLNITQVINTHEHWDHIEGNNEMAALGATIMAHHQAIGKIPFATKGLHEGDIIKVGSSIQLEVLDTPGHTMSHVCLFVRSPNHPALFSGDTLFNAGCGNCRNGGNVKAMYHTVTEKLANLPNETKLYPGHDYLQNNLNFALDRDPNNPKIQQLIKNAVWQNTPQFISTMVLEKEISPFFRLDNQEIINRLQEKFNEQETTYEKEEVFFRLRELRDKW
jgi:hydroxyacylglutathione hydrolase